MKILTRCFFILANVIFFGFINKPGTVKHKNLSMLQSPECLGERFSKFKIKRPDGSKFSNSDLKNKVVFVSFWQESSPNCMAELVAFNEMFNRLKDSSNFIFVLFSPDNDSSIHELVVKNGITYNFLHMDSDDCLRLNHGFGFPSSFILDRKEKIVYYIPGWKLTNEAIARTTVLEEYYPKVLETL